MLCDQTSNYKGKYRVLGGIAAAQMNYYAACRRPDLLIHLGETTGSYYTFKNCEVWRVSPDGEVRDPFKLLTRVFEMEEQAFFDCYNQCRNVSSESYYYQECVKEESEFNSLLPELPLSNVWLCQQTANKLPENSVLHLGILNTLRSWNLFDIKNSVLSYSNVGGFGIDGTISTCLGASLSNPDKIYFCVIGDLATFYDVNSLGNRHVSSNLRILVANNGTGYEMHCPGSIGRDFGTVESDRFFSAGGHFGNKSQDVLRHFSESLGFEYLKANTKEEYLEHLDYFVSPKNYEKPILFEVFIEEQDDDEAYLATRFLKEDASSKAKGLAKSILGEKGYKGLKIILKKN